MRKIFLYVIFTTLTQWGYAQENKSEWIIEPYFEDAKPFFEDLAAAKLKGKYGFINKKGEPVTHFMYEDAKNFNEGCAVVKSKGKWGAIDKQGKVVIPFQYDMVDDFYNGYAYVESGTTHKAFFTTWGMIVCTDIIDKKRFESLYRKLALKEIGKKKGLGLLTPFKDNEKWGYKRITLNHYVKEQLLPWDEFLSKRLSKLNSFDEDYLKSKIEPVINQWQKKGEFEPTAKWRERVNEVTRKKKIDELTEQYKKEYENNVKEYQKKYSELVDEYKKQYNELTVNYYYALTQEKRNEFSNHKFELKSYDADNQSFLISSEGFGDILISVSLEEAPSFKENWNTIKNTITPIYIPSGDDVVMNSLTMTNKGKKYTYNGQTQVKYAVTDVDYNFTPIEVSMPIVADVNYKFEPVEVIQSTIVQTTPVTKGLENDVKIEYVSLNATNRPDVDIDIPIAKSINNKIFAVVITNEEYIREVKVPYAINDGKIFAEYCKLTLGIPEEHVRLVENATLNDMKYHINWLKQVLDVTKGEAKVIFYYAGHGIPDETLQTAYILPVDGYGTDVSTGYSLNELYTTLGTLPSQSVTVFLDACFSGTKREGGMLTAARGVAIKVKANEPKGKMVVLSAAQGDETAYPYKEMGHGMFTYYLLKKLQETKGDVSIGELSTYIIDNVRRQSVILNGKVQTPTISFSTSLNDTWKEWKLR